MKRILVLLTILLSTYKLSAQEGLPFYTHYLVADKYLINPSFAGQDPSVLSVTGSYRNQWDDLPESPSTQTFSAHGAVFDRLAFGAYMFNDRNGLTKMTGGNISAAYHIPIDGRSYYESDDVNLFSFGMGVNFFQQRFDLNKVVAIDPNDPLLEDDSYMLTYFNLGASFQYSGLWGGISILDIPLIDNVPISNAVEPLPTWYYFMLGYKWKIADGLRIDPSVTLNLNSNSERKLDLNLFGHVDFGANNQGLDLGFSYRQDMDMNGSQASYIAPIVKVKVGQLRFGMSYDIGLSDVAPDVGNGYLFSLGWDFANPFGADFDR